MGPCLQGFSGPAPVTFEELGSWLQVTRTEITGEEALMLRSLSREYTNQLQIGRARNAVPPYVQGDDPQGKRALSAGIMAAARQQKERLKHG